MVEMLPGKAHSIEFVSSQYYEDFVCLKEEGVDKTRNMEHSGTCRNIPEHSGTSRNMKKKAFSWK